MIYFLIQLANHEYKSFLLDHFLATSNVRLSLKFSGSKLRCDINGFMRSEGGSRETWLIGKFMRHLRHHYPYKRTIITRDITWKVWNFDGSHVLFRPLAVSAVIRIFSGEDSLRRVEGLLDGYSRSTCSNDGGGVTALGYFKRKEPRPRNSAAFSHDNFEQLHCA